MPRRWSCFWAHGAGSAAIWSTTRIYDASATESASRPNHVGQLCRESFGSAAYLIGQGTDHGTVAAAANWDEPVEVMQVRPGYPDSYENLFHDTHAEAFCLPLRPRSPDVREEMAASRLERAIGVIYRPDTELASHYFRWPAIRRIHLVRSHPGQVISATKRGDSPANILSRCGSNPIDETRN
jgi:hypothetical protein